MRTIQGKGVSAGVARGVLYFMQRRKSGTEKRLVEDLDGEKTRLAEAQAASIAQLEELADKCREEAEGAATLFETHAMFVEDEDFVTCIMDTLEEEQCNGEYAVKTAGDQFSAMMAAMDDDYLRERAADIIDVTKRIINNMMGIVEGGIDSDVPVILAADDLAPSETLQLDKSKILAFATQGGSGNSHTAILARTMGIPAVCGLGDSLDESLAGKVCYIDGKSGQLTLFVSDIPATVGKFHGSICNQFNGLRFLIPIALSALNR